MLLLNSFKLNSCYLTIMLILLSRFLRVPVLISLNNIDLLLLVISCSR